MGTIIAGGREHEIPGIQVIQDALLPPADFFSPRRGSTYRGIILHHDACLSATQCLQVFRHAREAAHAGKPANRASTHFVIDNDGTVVQLADPLVWRAWSAREHDSGRVAVDISNACELKFADRYRPPRPVAEQVIHGQRIRWLAPYPCQVEALVALLWVFCRVAGIPARVPLRTDGTADLRLLDPVPDGVIGHLHCQRDRRGRPAKVDPFGLDWPGLQRAIS